MARKMKEGTYHDNQLAEDTDYRLKTPRFRLLTSLAYEARISVLL